MGGTRRWWARVALGVERSVAIILGIDTAGWVSGVALVAQGEGLASAAIRQRVAVARPLLRSIDRLLDWAGATVADLAGIAVNVGPGTFTGLRVGLATAQGLAMASGKPLIGCSVFDALVALVPEWHGVICPVVEARKGEVYAALYHQANHQLHQVMSGRVVPPEQVCALITERTLLLGSGVKAYGALFTATLGERAVCMHCGMEDSGVAVSVARVGETRLAQVGTGDLHPPAPLYIRPADARRPRQASMAPDGAHQ
jgi:tRNA threonylcarbamoyladenosine biosynthesis protein TsaB